MPGALDASRRPIALQCSPRRPPGLHFNLGAPASYADAFRRSAQAGAIDGELAARLSRAAGFLNVVAHAYDQLDMVRVFRAAKEGPADLRAFLAALRNRLG